MFPRGWRPLNLTETPGLRGVRAVQRKNSAATKAPTNEAFVRRLHRLDSRVLLQTSGHFALPGQLPPTPDLLGDQPRSCHTALHNEMF
jgi:hypothetical protein